MDKGIFEVHYKDKDKSKGIESVKVTDISSDDTVNIWDQLLKSEVVKKEDVIKEINDNTNEYYTVVDNKKGSKIEVVAGEYIRSDANSIEEDNLGSLETF